MSARHPNRLLSVLKLARRTEEEAQRTFADASADAETAEADLAEATERLAEITDISTNPARTPKQLFAQHQRAALRASVEAAADQKVKRMLDDQLAARAELMGAIRRRRSIENLEERQTATQAALASHAAQKALDELAVMRRNRRTS